LQLKPFLHIFVLYKESVTYRIFQYKLEGLGTLLYFPFLY